MKLTKENVYISLKGKTKEELADLYDFLKINNEPIYRTKERFLKYNDYYLVFSSDWQQMRIIDDKTEVTIEQLKEILKMTKNQELRKEAKKRGYTHNNFKCLNKSYNTTSIESLDKWYYNELEDTLFTNTRMNGGKAVYKNGVWAEFKETLQEKEQRLLKELEEVRKEIEDSKIKVGDWVVNTHHGSVFKNDTINLGINHPNRYKKITNLKLIKLLEQEIK